MANMKQCPSGHYYDGDRYSECPYCKPGSNAAGFFPPAGGISSGTVPGVTMPLNSTGPSAPKASPDMEKTVRLGVQESGINPVVGWLVCTSGTDKGLDFRLHAGNNFVGRSPEMDVPLKHDPAVSGTNHFSISYDRRHDRFYIAMGTGKEIVYLNDEPLTAGAQDLKRGDEIEVGSTKLMFVPLCGADFQWKWDK